MYMLDMPGNDYLVHPAKYTLVYLNIFQESYFTIQKLFSDVKNYVKMYNLTGKAKYCNCK